MPNMVSNLNSLHSPVVDGLEDDTQKRPIQLIAAHAPARLRLFLGNGEPVWCVWELPQQGLPGPLGHGHLQLRKAPL